QKAGVGLSPARFWAGSIAAGCFALLLVSALTGSVFVALVPAVAVALLPRAYFSRRRRLRMREVQAAVPDVMRGLAASIAPGRPLAQPGGRRARHARADAVATRVRTLPADRAHARQRPGARTRATGAGRSHERPRDRGAVARA